MFAAVILPDANTEIPPVSLGFGNTLQKSDSQFKGLLFYSSAAYLNSAQYFSLSACLEILTASHHHLGLPRS